MLIKEMIDVDNDVYDILTRSVRECYVPATKWLDYISRFETCGTFEFRYTSDAYESMKRMYVLPYPFKNPAVVEYIMRTKRVTITPEDSISIKAIIDERVQRYVDNAIHDDWLAYLDSNPDYGVVLHTISGRNFPFQYSKVSGFTFITASEAMIAGEIFGRSNGNIVAPGTNMASTGKYPLDSYFMYYAPQYIDKDGDCFFKFGTYNMTTEYCTHTAEHIRETEDYMNDMFASHSKCIIVT